MFTYMYNIVYIYTILSGHPHIHIYIYFKPHNPSTQPSQQQQPAAAAAAAAAGCCYTFEEMEEMQASANVPILDIYQVYHLNGIYKICGKYSHHIFELYTRFINLDWW